MNEGLKYRLLHQLFELQAEPSPEAIAVVFEEKQLTYRELNARANQLAHYLKTQGVGPEVLVGICTERSIEMVVGLLGILKAGAAYVPLDPSYPQERLAFMLEDSRVPVLLTQQSLVESLPNHQARVLCLDADWEIIAQHSEENPNSQVAPENLAYTIYTSGSTGKPKGAMNTHAGICNRLLWMQQTYPLNQSDRVLQKTPFSFDVSVWEFFWPLLAGARLVIAKPEGHKYSAYLVELIAQQQITTLHFVPSMLQVFIEEPELKKCQSIKRIICSGEALPWNLQQRCFERLDVEIYNLYGPTEASVEVTFWKCQPQSDLLTVPIGRPIDNISIYVLDSQMQPLPVGGSGELYIGGVGVARGYLNRPDLSAEKFIPNPFSQQPGDRLYKTGDLARYLPDGNIEYLGRIDSQVKVRGFRIELGEIEATLWQHHEVREVVVTAREDVPGDKRLVAYIVSNLIPDRIPYESAVTVEFDANSVKAITEDLSVGGVCVFGLPEIQLGQRIRLRLKLPGATDEQWFVGKIAWKVKQRTGIEFDLTPTETALLGEIIDELLETQGLLKTLQRTLARNLRAFLKEKLPEYMVPSSFVLLKSLPLTPNGKVDRRSLPAPESTRLTGKAERQPLTITSYSLEVSKIQALLNQHPGVAEAAIALHADVSAGTRSVAYCVPDSQFAFPVKQWLRLETEGAIANWARYELPNGMKIVHLHKNETDFLYNEIFEDRTYLKHGITLNPGDCIFDVGANIGMFALFASQICPNAVIYAFEPIPPVFEILRLNAAIYGFNIKVFDCGIANENKLAEFTYYPGASLSSGRFDNPVEEKDVLKSFLLNQKSENSEPALPLQEIDELQAEHLKGETFNCQLKTISEVMRSQGIKRIDLLKIDVEKSELDVLAGIQEDDWQKIEQIVLEVRDVQDRLVQIFRLLVSRGYDLAIEQDPLLKHTGLYNIYASRPSRKQKLANAIDELGDRPERLTWSNPNLLIADVRRFLQEKLPDAAIPSAFFLADALPKTPDGQVDLNALGLLHPEANFNLEETFAAPRTPVEEVLAAIWAEVLGLDRVSIRDNFWEWGGHSLLAARVIARSRNALQVELPEIALFEAPTVAELAQKVETIRQETPNAQVLPIQRVARNQNLPLSFGEQQIWFLAELELGLPFYNEHLTIYLSGSINVAALERSFNEIVRRHEILRTGFSLVDGQPVRIFKPVDYLPLPVTNLQAIASQEEREAEALRLATEQVRQPFDLTEPPLWRGTLMQLSETDYRLYLSVHHIICDAGSFYNVLFPELTALYKAFSSGEPSLLPELAVQYADFAVWQRQYLQPEIVAPQLAYWKQQLANLPALQLPTDRPRPAAGSFRGAMQTLTLSLSLTEAIEALSRRENVTLFVTLMATFKTLLYRYTGQTDLPVGTVISNRNRSEIEGAIGYFLNTLVMRTDVAGNPTFRELLKRERKVALEAYANQYLPFEKLVEELHPDRKPGQNPLFQFSFVLQPFISVLDSDWRLSQLDVHTGTAKFDLHLELDRRPEGVMGRIEYSTDLFDESTIRRLIGHFQMLLEAIAANPEQRLEDLPLLTEPERQLLLGEWNNTQVEYPKNLCLHQLFELQVERRLLDEAKRSPEAIAVVFEENQLTYQELNARANQLAHYLKTQGVGPEVLVGICTERSIEMVVGLLGILKAGAAYVPLDPSYPQERLAFMLEDSRVPVLLTQNRLIQSLPNHQAQVLCLDTDWQLIAQHSQENPNNPVAPENLAYTIYTSGSTGKPKGAMNSHAGICNRLLWMQQTYPLNQSDRVLQKTPFSFDVSVWEFFWPLLAGARLVIAKPEGHKDSAYLVELIAQQQITTLHFVPSMLQVFIEERELEEKCQCIKRIICSGEALPWNLQQRCFERLEAELHNLYGPTEAAVDVTFWQCRSQSDLLTVPIGRPIDNISIYVLDSQMQPVPVGVSGELYIGGVGVARGYLNRPDLSAEKFIPNPFSQQPGDRLYKTGDLARYLPNGNIEYLGRIDSQVKIRGFRIELGEIEATLAEHPAVQVAVVAAREDVPGQKRLVAYIVSKPFDKALQESMAQWQADFVSQWQTLYEDTYGQTPVSDNLTLNLSGWNSSYTGQPIPAEEMRQWVDSTVERILSPHPTRVLEIGCGTGLLLSRIAPHCDQYWATDFSQEALQYVQQLKESQPELARVRLLQKVANDFTGIESEAFDSAILNSVIQYFPSIDYLLEVLEGAVRSVESGGVIFIGDVRSLPLLEAYHASVELFRSSDELPLDRFLQRVRSRVANEEELVVDPAFFHALPQHFPEISQVQILLKRGDCDNELTRFRYDAILYVGGQVSAAADISRSDWQEAGLTLPMLRQMLADAKPELLGLRSVPNSRVFLEIKMLELLANPDGLKTVGLKTVGELRKALSQFEGFGVEPEALWRLSDDLGYGAEITWSSSANGCYDVVFWRRAEGGDSLRNNVTSRYHDRVSIFQEAVPTLKPWSDYATHPLQGKLTRNLLAQLRGFLQEKLPAYMVPSAFVFLDALPTTPNGKLDRRALPIPESNRSNLENSFVASRTTVETQISSLWTKVLGIENVGIRDNFFEIGGNSLLAAQLISWMRELFQIELPVRCIFESPTVEGLARWVDRESADEISSLTPVLDLKAEAVLDADIIPNGVFVDNFSDPQSIFLTGATGFLGAFLLSELLEKTSASIYCLVRASDASKAAQKLRTNLEKYLLWKPLHASRIIAVVGDLERPLFGLSLEKFGELAAQIDSIYHSGAQANFAKPYSVLKASNVLGTQDIIRLACAGGKVKPVHYISTIGIFGPIGYFTGTKLICEDDNIDDSEAYLSHELGYTHSKWVAEKLVWIAKSRGIPVTVIRPGFIMGDSRTGVTNTSDYVSRLIKGCIELGSFPQLVGQKQVLITVDYASQAIVHLSRQKSSFGKAFHLTPLPADDIDLITLLEMVCSRGYSLKKLPYSQWKEELIQATRHSLDNPLYPLLPMLAEKVYSDSLTLLELFENSPDYDSQNTLEALAGSSIVCPIMDAKLIDTYLSWFIDSGFIAPPTGDA